MIKSLFTLLLIYMLYRAVRFFFTAFMMMYRQRKQVKSMMDLMRNMRQNPQQAQQQAHRQYRREGDVAIDYIPEEPQKPDEKPRRKGGEYVDYEVIK